MIRGYGEIHDAGLAIARLAVVPPVNTPAEEAFAAVAPPPPDPVRPVAAGGRPPPDPGRSVAADGRPQRSEEGIRTLNKDGPAVQSCSVESEGAVVSGGKECDD